MILREYEYYGVVLAWIRQLLREKETAVISIDGRCGSGKTMLAELLQEVFSCSVIHADDYYLPLSRRAAGWEQIPCANMDLERLLREAVLPAKAGKGVEYRPYSCQTGEYLPGKRLEPRPLTVIEGSYCQHPLLAEQYDMKIFLTCSKEVQRRRLSEREGDYFPLFERQWIPLEEKYFYQFQIQQNSLLMVDTSEFFEME